MFSSHKEARPIIILIMRYLDLARKLFVLLVIIAFPHITWADDDLNFIFEICIQGMSSEPSIPRAESESFCSCVGDRVKKSITNEQRLAIREAKNRMRLGQAIPEDFFQKSGLKDLIVRNQDHCIRSQWPKTPKFSKKDHKKYSLMAEKSVIEFNSLLSARCDKYPKSNERNRCLVDASKEWLKTKGKKYVGIPSIYLTGNDLAEKFIEKEQ